MEKDLSFGQYIAYRRKHMGLTQEKLANRMDVSKSAIAKWETNGGLPDRDNLNKLAKVIGVSVDELHNVIAKETCPDQGINITADVISALEAYGYKVICPGEEDN